MEGTGFRHDSLFEKGNLFKFILRNVSKKLMTSIWLSLFNLFLGGFTVTQIPHVHKFLEFPFVISGPWSLV